MVKWNLNDLFPIDKIDNGLSELTEKVQKFKENRELLKPNIEADSFLSLVKEVETIKQLISKIDGSSYMYLSKNFKDNQRTSLHGKISQKIAEIRNELLFFPLWFKNLDDEKRQRL